MSACATPQPICVTVVNGTSNYFEVALDGADGDVMSSLAAITRITITIGDTTIDSDTVGSSVIWWTETADYRGATVGVARFRLGGQSLTAGTYAGCYVTVYDASAANGWRYGTPLKVTVV